MSGAQLAIDDWEQLRKPIDDANAQAMLHMWQAERAKLGFGYFRLAAIQGRIGTATNATTTCTPVITKGPHG